MTATQHESSSGRARETRVVVGYSNKTGRGDLQPKSGALPSVERKASLPAEWGGLQAPPGPSLMAREIEGFGLNWMALVPEKIKGGLTTKF